MRSDVLARKIPLGRILILNNLFRQVELGALWRVNVGPELRLRAGLNEASTYGRTALIHVNGAPAIELLEIVIPSVPPD